MADQLPFEQWFDVNDCPDPHTSLKRVSKMLYDSQGQERKTDADSYLSLYLGSTRWSARGYRYGSLSGWPWMYEGTPSLNIIQAITDTMAGMLLRQRIRPFVITEGGNWEQREQAQAMQLAIEAQFRADGTYDELGTRWCYDGLIFDGGGIKSICDYQNHRIIAERVLPWEVLVPEREGYSGRGPRQMFHCYPMPRASLLSMYATDKQARDLIVDSQPVPWEASTDPYPEEGHVTDLVWVVEGWHKHDGYLDLDEDKEVWGEGSRIGTPKWKHSGRHSIILENGTLCDEAWPHDFFPISWFRPNMMPTSFWSRGVPQTLVGLQAAIHRMNRRVDRILHLHARPIVYTYNRANINTDKIDNDSAGIISGDLPPGQAMQYITPTSVPGELVARIRELGEWAQKQYGVSEQSVQANRPPGIEHAPALQQLQEMETMRHTPAFRDWERAHIHKARVDIEMFRMLAKFDPKFSLMWGEDEELKKINWKKVDLGRDNVRITVMPTNFLPQTPGAKIERVMQLIQSGMLGQQPEKAWAFFTEFPDIKSFLKNADAERRNIEMKLAAIVKDGDYEKAMPSSYLNIDLAQSIALEWINEMEADGLEPEKLDMLRRWHRDVTRIKERAMPPPVPQLPVGPGASPGPPNVPAPPGPVPGPVPMPQGPQG